MTPSIINGTESTIQPLGTSRDTVAEISIILPRHQFGLLQAIADSNATTVGTIIRRILSESLSGSQEWFNRPDRVESRLPRECPVCQRTYRVSESVCSHSSPSPFSNAAEEVMEYARTAIQVAEEQAAINSLRLLLAVPGRYRDKTHPFPEGSGVAVSLNLVQRLVEWHRGEIGVISNGTDEGDEYVVVIPIGDKTQSFEI